MTVQDVLVRRRVVELVGKRAERMWVSTFHSACLRMLRSHASILGYQPSFTVYDDVDSRRAAVAELASHSAGAVSLGMPLEASGPEDFRFAYGDDCSGTPGSSRRSTRRFSCATIPAWNPPAASSKRGGSHRPRRGRCGPAGP